MYEDEVYKESMCKYFTLGYLGLYWIFCITGVGVLSEPWGWFSSWGETAGPDGASTGRGTTTGQRGKVTVHGRER